MIYAFLAKGFEEVEAIATIDVIRRAELEVCTVGVGSKLVCGSHNIPVFCDLEESEVSIDDNVDGIILPGGMPGTLNLEKNKTVNDFIEYAVNNNKLIAAICAAPSILGHKGLLNGKEATCFPGFESELAGAKISDKYVVTDGNIITARGMGSAIEFGLAVSEYFCGKDEADRLKNTLQCPQ
ncbi:MAG: DJ-1/PfpI family protein [Clostridia bacterium]|nr:DJ-1/PfpI family protein [Clostridia bacterium]